MEDLRLTEISSADLAQFKADMQEAFQFYATEGLLAVEGTVLPETDIDDALAAPGTIAYKAVRNGEMLGGAVVSIDGRRCYGHLDFLYVKRGVQSKGVGKFIWFEIERLHPDVAVWETITPAFAKRNIHFYLNVCGFQIVEYFNPHHPNPNPPVNYDGPDDDFVFRKVRL